MRIFLTLTALLSIAGVAEGQCNGDFDGNGGVTVDEIILSVNNALNGCPLSAFVDNGDGTVTDTATGLMWEQKIEGAGCLHCVEDVYTWDSAMTDWIAQVNYSDERYDDWRLPSFEELWDLRRFPTGCGNSVQCIDPIFNATTATKGYWSSSKFPPEEQNGSVLVVEFLDGSFYGPTRNESFAVRAVRGTRIGPR